MSQVAFSRDIGDPKTVRDFANIVQSPERLKLLLVLTVADIRAVGPGTWNGWKGQLLRALYYEAEPVVAGGHTQLGSKARVETAQERFRTALSDWLLRTSSVLSIGTIRITGCAPTRAKPSNRPKMVRSGGTGRSKVCQPFTTDTFTAITELSVFAPNHPRLLALFAGACAAAGANISGAHISTTRDGFALDTFLLAREFEPTRTSCAGRDGLPRPSRSF